MLVIDFFLIGQSLKKNKKTHPYYKQIPLENFIRLHKLDVSYSLCPGYWKIGNSQIWKTEDSEFSVLYFNTKTLPKK